MLCNCGECFYCTYCVGWKVRLTPTQTGESYFITELHKTREGALKEAVAYLKDEYSATKSQIRGWVNRGIILLERVD